MNPPIGALHELSRAIGALEAGVANLTKNLDEEREAAKTHRESLREVIAALTEAVRVLTEHMQEIRPIVQDYRKKSEMFAGMAMMGRVGMALWVALSAAIGAVVSWVLHR